MAVAATAHPRPQGIPKKVCRKAGRDKHASTMPRGVLDGPKKRLVVAEPQTAEGPVEVALEKTLGDHRSPFWRWSGGSGAEGWQPGA